MAIFSDDQNLGMLHFNNTWISMNHKIR